jgi:hypothetical protein
VLTKTPFQSPVTQKTFNLYHTTVTEAQKQQSKASNYIPYLSNTKITSNIPQNFPPQAENSLSERQHRQKTESQELSTQGVQDRWHPYCKVSNNFKN